MHSIKKLKENAALTFKNSERELCSIANSAILGTTAVVSDAAVAADSNTDVVTQSTVSAKDAGKQSTLPQCRPSKFDCYQATLHTDGIFSGICRFGSQRPARVNSPSLFCVVWRNYLMRQNIDHIVHLKTPQTDAPTRSKAHVKIVKQENVWGKQLLYQQVV